MKLLLYNTTEVDKEPANYKKKLVEVQTNKTNLEESIDNFPLDTKYRERKLKDMQGRLDGHYELLDGLEEKIGDATLRREAMLEEAFTLENIRKILLSFDKVYDKMTGEERKDFYLLSHKGNSNLSQR